MALIISRLNYRILNRFSTALYVAALVLMALVKTPLGQSSHGAQRWLNLGPVQFQPAELAKIAVIVCLPYMIVHMGKKVRTLKGCMVLAVVGGGLALAAYVFTDNLSTAIIIFCITAGLIFVAHPDIKIFMNIASDVQLANIRKRNGEEKAKEFQEKWIPKEEAYFEKFHVQDDTLEIMWNLKVL